MPLPLFLALLAFFLYVAAAVPLGRWISEEYGPWAAFVWLIVATCGFFLFLSWVS